MFQSSHSQLLLQDSTNKFKPEKFQLTDTLLLLTDSMNTSDEILMSTKSTETIAEPTETTAKLTETTETIDKSTATIAESTDTTAETSVTIDESSTKVATEREDTNGTSSFLSCTKSLCSV